MTSSQGKLSSPPGTLQLPNLKKRPASFSTAGPKRRNLSTSTSVSHPLRQTSFPPPEYAALGHTPPITQEYEGSATERDSLTEAISEPQRRKRTKSIKEGKLSQELKSGDRQSNSEYTHFESRYDDDFDDEDGDHAVNAELEGATQLDEAAADQEKQHLALLLNAFSTDQTDRYTAYRSTKLKKEIVRKIINQTVSQSVPQNIVTVVGGYTKYFAGEIIEIAREVQVEWLAASPSSVYQLTSDDAEKLAATANAQESDIPEGVVCQASTAAKKQVRGPLTPDHLREALRRYRKDSKGGGAGFQGLSLHGKDNVAVRSSGRRLFR